MKKRLVAFALAIVMTLGASGTVCFAECNCKHHWVEKDRIVMHQEVKGNWIYTYYRTIDYCTECGSTKNIYWGDSTQKRFYR